MKKISRLATLTTMALFLMLPIGSAAAISIVYEVEDLADTGSGDLWQYTYYVSDHTFMADHGFAIYFDLGLYENLDFFPPQPNADWDAITFEPDPMAVPSDGWYDALALADNASLADPFVVSFEWIGPGAPGAQFFELYDPDFIPIDGLSGFTAPASPPTPVPEPATLILLGAGLLGLAGFRRTPHP